MIATFLVRLVCISCAWFFASAVGVKARAEQPLADEPLEVNQPLGKRGPGIAGCFTPAIKSYQVRIQSLKTSDGPVYSRQLVTTADIPYVSNSITKDLPAATNIAACAEATAKGGLNSFLWEDGACMAFLAWRPRTHANCRDGGSKVVFVAMKPLTPCGGGELVVSGNIRYDPPEAFLDISSQYGVCGFGVPVVKGYKLQWNGTQVERLDAGTTTYNLTRKQLCANSKNISLWSVGEDGEVNSKEIQLTINRGSSRWYGLQTGGCVHDMFNRSIVSDANPVCQDLGLTVFYEKVDGEAAAFLDALDALDDFITNPFIVGLTYQEFTDHWEWTEGLVQPKADAEVWGDGHPGEGSCTIAVNGSFGWSIHDNGCNTEKPLVCYLSNP